MTSTMPSPNSSTTMTEPLLNSRIFWGSWIAFWVAWSLYSFPALTQAWWFLDDYNIYDPRFGITGLLKGGVYNSRPMQGVYCLLSLLDAPPAGNGGNVLARLLQIGGHALAGTGIIFILARRLDLIAAMLSAAVFTLWCFHGQATLWYAAQIYPFGAAFSVWAVVAILEGYKRQSWTLCISGVFAFIASVLSNQLVAPLGLMAYLILIALRWAHNQFQLKQAVRESTWILTGLILGGAISIALMILKDHSRVYEASIAERLIFMGKQVDLYFRFPSFYPGYLKALHGLTLAIVLGSIVYAFVQFGKAARRSLVLIPVVILMPIGALSAVLLSGSLFPSFRIMYVLPILGTALLVTGFHFAGNALWPRRILIACASAVILAYGPTAWLNARDMVANYNNDVETLHKMEQAAKEAGTNKVLFMDWQNSGPWDTNPYDLTYNYSGNLKSVIQTMSSNYRVVWYYTDLENVHWSKWEPLRNKYANFAKSLPREPKFQFHYKSQDDVLLVVPR